MWQLREAFADEDTTILRSHFVEKHEVQLRRWVEELESLRGPIVAISRKGPRLLELLTNEGIASADLFARVTSEHALPFLGELSEDIVVVDDSVIHGSTFTNIVLAAQAVQHANGRGRGTIYGVPFALGKNANERCIRHINKHFLSLGAGDVAPFVSSAAYAFRLLGVPYGVEYPTFGVTSSAFTSGTTRTRVLLNVAATLGGELLSVTHRVPLAGGDLIEVEGWTILLKQPFVAERVGHSCVRKLRIYADPSDPSHLVVAAMRSDPITLDDLPTWLSKLPNSLTSAWERVVGAIPESGGDDFRRVADRSQVTLANYLGSLSLGGVARAAFEDALNVEEVPAEWQGPRLADLRMLLGPELAIELYDVLAERCNHPIDESNLTNCPDLFAPKNTTEFDHIPPAFTEGYEKLKSELVATAESPEEVLRAVFQAQHMAIEKASRNTDVPGNDRLDFGLSLGTLFGDVIQRLPEATPGEFHQALDTLIDTGCAVPRYLQKSVGGRSIWSRAFRVGEGANAPRVHALQMFFMQLASALGTADGSIPAIVLEKFCVLALTGGVPDPRLAPLGSMGIKKKFYLFGARAVTNVQDEEPFLLDWAIKRRVFTRQDTSGRRGSEAAYLLDPDVGFNFPIEDSPWDDNVVEGIVDLAAFTRRIVETPGLKTDALISITSTATKSELNQAAQTELGLWLDNSQLSVFDAIDRISTLARLEQDGAKREEEASRISFALHRLANFPAQAQAKSVLSQQLSDTFLRIDAAVQGDTLAPRAWRKIRQDIENRRGSEEITRGLNEVFAAVSIAEKVTRVLRAILAVRGRNDDAGLLLAMQQLKDTLGVLKNSSRIIRVFVEKENERSSIDLVLDSALRLANASFSDRVKVLRPILIALADVCASVLSLYDVSISAQPSTILEPPRFVAMWDIRNSSDLEDQPARNRAVERANRAIAMVLGGRVLDFRPLSHDDGNGLVAESLEDVLTSFKILADSLHPIPFRMGCEVNVQGRLHYYGGEHNNLDGESRKTLGTEGGGYGGRAYEFAARMMGFFKEISADPSRWNGSDPRPTEPDASYLVVGEFAKRYGEAAQHGQWPPADSDLSQPQGKYLPRVRTSLPLEVFVLVRRAGADSQAILSLGV